MVVCAPAGASSPRSEPGLRMRRTHGRSGSTSADAVVQGQIELLESDKGLSPADVARQTFEKKAKTERTLAATIHGERRTLRVSDLPLGLDGVAGYAIDIEEQQFLHDRGVHFNAGCYLPESGYPHI